MVTMCRQWPLLDILLPPCPAIVIHPPFLVTGREIKLNSFFFTSNDIKTYRITSHFWLGPKRKALFFFLGQFILTYNITSCFKIMVENQFTGFHPLELNCYWVIGNFYFLIKNSKTLAEKVKEKLIQLMFCRDLQG